MTLILIFFQLLILLDVYILMYAFTESRRPTICHIAFGQVLVGLLILNILKIELDKLPNEGIIYGLTQALQNIPLAFYTLLLLILFASSGLIFYKEYRYKQNTITESSIKESIDNLPMGLGFSTEDGLVILSNRTLNKLCHEITGRELRDAQKFWQNLQAQKPKKSPYLEGNHETILRLENGQTWSFGLKQIQINNKKGRQITAIDITELGKLQTELKKKNLEFEKMNTRLKKYSENLSLIKAKEERLATKAQLHNQLGYILLATRRSLTSGRVQEDGQAIRDLWQ